MSALRTLVLSSRPLSWVNTAFPFGLTYYLFVGNFDAVFVVGSLFFLMVLTYSTLVSYLWAGKALGARRHA